MECNKRNRNIRCAIFRDSNLKKLREYLVLQSNNFGPLFFYIFGRFVKTKCRTFLRMAHKLMIQ